MALRPCANYDLFKSTFYFEIAGDLWVVRYGLYTFINQGVKSGLCLMSLYCRCQSFTMEPDSKTAGPLWTLVIFLATVVSTELEQ